VTVATLKVSGSLDRPSLRRPKQAQELKITVVHADAHGSSGRLAIEMWMAGAVTSASAA
jgi:hypothetical protein